MTAEPSPVSQLTEPLLAFGGDCANVITDTQLTGVLGPAAGPRTEGGLDLFWLPSAETGGGLQCAWNANAAEQDRVAGVSYVWADVLASDVVPAATKEHYSVARCEGVYDGTMCHVGVESGGAWALVSTGLQEYGDEVAPDVLGELASVVSSNARSYTSPVALPPDENGWARPDCEKIGKALIVDEFFSNPKPGHWEGGPDAFHRILSDTGLEVTCPWFSEYLDAKDVWGTLTVTVAPGSGWAWSEIGRIEGVGSSEGPPVVSSEIQVVGAVAARQISYGEGQRMVIATDGTNIVRVEATTGDPVVAAQRVLGALARDR
jgi:hypothetical protein